MNFSNLKISIGFDWESISRLNYRPFLFGMVAVLLFQIATLAGWEAPSFINPVVEESTVSEQISEKLMKRGHEFKLRKNNTFIPEARAAEAHDVARAYTVVDLETGDVILEKNISTQYSIASVTKVMTAVVALDLAELTDEYTVTENAAEVIPTKIGVVSGQKMTLEELLTASLLTSANDATEVIREGIDAQYGDEVFINAMNDKAQFLEMHNTHFTNPQGFDNDEHYSTAGDLAILTQYALTQYPEIATIVEKEYQYLSATDNHKQFDLYNWNGLLGVYPEVYGLKIGNTGNAGFTTIVASRRGGKNLAVILLGAPGVKERDLWAATLLDKGYEQALGLPPILITEDILQEKYSRWKYFN